MTNKLWARIAPQPGKIAPQVQKAGPQPPTRPWPEKTGWETLRSKARPQQQNAWIIWKYTPPETNMAPKRKFHLPTIDPQRQAASFREGNPATKACSLSSSLFSPPASILPPFLPPEWRNSHVANPVRWQVKTDLPVEEVVEVGNGWGKAPGQNGRAFEGDEANLETYVF